MTRSAKRPQGMFAFIVIWLGQIISVLASSMSQFALTIFMYEQTGSATALGLMQVFYFIPFLLISPVAGVMIDRHNRKLMMMISDLGAGIATLAILAYVCGIHHFRPGYSISVAGLFRRNLDHDFEGTTWARQRHDVADGSRAGRHCPDLGRRLAARDPTHRNSIH